MATNLYGIAAYQQTNQTWKKANAKEEKTEKAKSSEASKAEKADTSGKTSGSKRRLWYGDRRCQSLG